MRDGEDWLSRTIQTVDAVVRQNGFAQSASPRVERSVNEPVAGKRLRLEALLLVSNTFKSASFQVLRMISITAVPSAWA